MPSVAIRPPRAGDGAGLARAHLDGCRYYTAMDPDAFQVPASQGLAAWFEDLVGRETKDDMLRLVAVVDGEVVGCVMAGVERPHQEASWQLPRDLSRVRLLVHALTVAEPARRMGIGTRLMEAAEAWGRRRGATVALLDTYAQSPLSVPFYEERMGYARHAIVFRKRLAG